MQLQQRFFLPAITPSLPAISRASLKTYTNLVLLKLTRLYTFIVLLIWGISLFTGDHWKLAGLYRNMLPAAFFPIILYILIGMMNRRWILACCTLPMVWGFSSEYLYTFMNPLPTLNAQHTFTILTYNAYGAERDLSGALRLIQDADTDIVAVQEMSVSAAELFAQALADLYPYQVLHPQPDMILGHGVLSRYPIMEDELFYVNERPSFQRVVIALDEQHLTLFNVHTKPPSIGFMFRFNVHPREAIVETLVNMALQETNPVVMVGDFNMTQSSDDYYRITRNFTDLHRQVGRGLGLTYPARKHNDFLSNFIPLLSRLDYIFYNDGVHGLRTRVWSSSGGSDHRPVWGLLSLST